MNGEPTCRVYLIRHGETANAGQVCFNGHFDVDISPAGREQFLSISESLKNVSIHAFYSSDLKRTRICAEIVSKPHGLKPTAFSELRELSFGEWEGMSVAEVNQKFPNQLENRLKNIETFSVKGGETFLQLQERVIPKFEEIVGGHSNETIVILAHGGVNRIILGHVLGIPMSNIFRIQQEYGAINVIQYYQDNGVAELIGGTHHHIPAPPVEDKKIAIQ
ncbi:MAG: alpha-ribazole phosphatase [Nitrospinaceae bacterium]|nr:MAG: alpha-ribazole phosphatase [Nitrospinaceae bacterium]